MPLLSLAARGSHIASAWLAAPRVNCHRQGEGEAVSRALRDQKEVLQAALRHQSPATPCSCFAASLGFLLAGVVLGALLGAAAVLAFRDVGAAGIAAWRREAARVGLGEAALDTLRPA